MIHTAVGQSVSDWAINCSDKFRMSAVGTVNAETAETMDRERHWNPTTMSHIYALQSSHSTSTNHC